MADSEMATCDICKTVTKVDRKYYHYNIQCGCCSGENHIEIVRYCKSCTPIPPKRCSVITVPIEELTPNNKVGKTSLTDEEKTNLKDEKSITDFINGKVVYDNDDQYFWIQTEPMRPNVLAEMRGWGKIQKMFFNSNSEVDLVKAAEYQDKIGKFIAEAINEKIKNESK